MSKSILSTTNAPGAIGPYSQGISIGDLVFTSGQIPINPVDGKVVSDDIRKATAQSLENVKAILTEAGTSMENVIKTTIFLKDLNDFAAVNEVYGEYFKTNFPVRSCIQVAKLPMDVLVEIEVIAIK